MFINKDAENKSVINRYKFDTSNLTFEVSKEVINLTKKEIPSVLSKFRNYQTFSNFNWKVWDDYYVILDNQSNFQPDIDPNKTHVYQDYDICIVNKEEIG